MPIASSFKCNDLSNRWSGRALKIQEYRYCRILSSCTIASKQNLNLSIIGLRYLWGLQVPWGQIGYTSHARRVPILPAKRPAFPTLIHLHTGFICILSHQTLSMFVTMKYSKPTLWKLCAKLACASRWKNVRARPHKHTAVKSTIRSSFPQKNWDDASMHTNSREEEK